MKHNRITPTGDIELDIIKAIKRHSRETYGFYPPRMTKNKKKFDRSRRNKIFLQNLIKINKKINYFI